MIYGQNVFDQSIANYLITYGNIRKIRTFQGDVYTAGCLLDYRYFKDHYKLTSIDFSKGSIYHHITQYTTLYHFKCKIF